ncbi:MAG TPA: hypothetical protein VFZ65_23625 [Planctomycetota bacterium]|nr:hypothetical protein [Planctomycetota bacterium]
MNTSTQLAALLLLPCFVATASAQVQIPINPKATYLRTENDPNAVPTPGIPLSAIGTAPGQWLSITTVGAYSDGGNPDTSKNLICVFSNSATLLPNAPGLVNRVPGAISAGADVVTPHTYYGNYATDIPQDFVVTRDTWTNGALVKVPVGATHIFFTVNDPSWVHYSNNADPNSDYFVVFSAGSPPALHGTEEHCELRTGVNGAPTLTPEVKQAAPFSTLNADVGQKWGLSTGDLYLLAANLYLTAGSPPVGPLPDFYMGSTFVIVQVGVTAAAPAPWSFFVPPGQAGHTLILQGFFLTNTARNGLLSASDAHRIELQ